MIYHGYRYEWIGHISSGFEDPDGLPTQYLKIGKQLYEKKEKVRTTAVEPELPDYITRKEWSDEAQEQIAVITKLEARLEETRDELAAVRSRLNFHEQHG